MPNRRLPDAFLALASALLERTLRPVPRTAARAGPHPPWRGAGAAVLAWLATFCAAAAAATAGPADAPAPPAPGPAASMPCPAHMDASWPDPGPDVPGQRPAAGRTRRPDARHASADMPAAGVPEVPGVPGEPARPSGRPIQAARLLRASFYRGDPRALDVLPPEATHRAGDVETSTWDFAEESAMPVWIACVYSGDAVLASRPLPPGTRACTARLRITPMGDPAGLLAVHCR
jgi:hypothetical protein